MRYQVGLAEVTKVDKSKSMSSSVHAKKALSAIDKQGVLLVFPITNRKEPASLWSTLWPRSEMKWEWDQEGDQRVAQLWHLREELSRSQRVVYAKWYQGRATFFSRKVFTLFMAQLRTAMSETEIGLSDQAKNMLNVLKMDSPLSTKQLKVLTGLRGRDYEAEYQRSLKELWSKLLIVGFGEINDGAFPSLAIGATQNLFEDLWNQSSNYTSQEADEELKKILPKNSLFLNQLSRYTRSLSK
jgi:hypothetical protein